MRSREPGSPTERAADLLVRGLLCLYPGDFRRRYGPEMRAAFHDQARGRMAEAGRRGWMGLLARTVVGMLRGAAAEWRASWRGPPGTDHVRRDGDGRGGVRDEPDGAGPTPGAMGPGTTGGDGMGRERTGMWTRIAGETRQARRRLARAPGFAAVAVLTVGLGVGAFASVWVVVESVLLEPLPYEEPEDLAWVWRDYTWFDLSRGWLGGPDVAGMAERDDAFDGVAALRWGRMNLTGPAGDIFLDGQPSRVVGVLPEGFDFVMARSLGSPRGADVYVPLQLDMAAQDPGSGFLAGLVRVRGDVPAARVEAALAAVADRVDDAWEGRELRLWAAPLREDLVADVREPLLAVLVAAGFLLLTLGANLATLLLARSAIRERETATRRALGAGRVDVAASVLGEVVLLAGGGALLGVGLTWQGARILAGVAADALPRTAEIALDGSGIALAVAMALILGLLAAAAPVVRALRGDPRQALREAGTRGGESRRRVRGRNVLVVAQVALSVVLLVGAGLLGRSLAGLLSADPGFDPAGVLTLRISLDPGRYADSLAIHDFVVEAEEQLAALPGVDAVGVSEALPLATGTNQTGAEFPGAPGNSGDPDADRPLVDQLEVGPGFFRAMGLRLLQGRAFSDADAGDGALPAVIDDVLARRFFPDGSAVGARLWTGGDTATVVGVVDQARLYDVHRDDRGQVYYPSWMDPDAERYVVLRTDGDPSAVAGGARAALRSLDASVPVSDVRTMEQVVRDALGEQRLNLLLVAVFALSSLLLAALGVYGVVANAVVRRRGEIGVRMAMGAEGGRVIRTVLGDGLRLVALGIVVGVPVAWAASRMLSSLLFGVAPMDPWTWTGVAGLLGGVALAAAWLPARRATRISPSEALRSL